MSHICYSLSWQGFGEPDEGRLGWQRAPGIKTGHIWGGSSGEKQIDKWTGSGKTIMHFLWYLEYFSPR